MYRLVAYTTYLERVTSRQILCVTLVSSTFSDVNISGSPYTGADESETAGLIDVKSSKPRKTNFCLVGVLCECNIG